MFSGIKPMKARQPLMLTFAFPCKRRTLSLLKGETKSIVNKTKNNLLQSTRAVNCD